MANTIAKMSVRELDAQIRKLAKRKALLQARAKRLADEAYAKECELVERTNIMTGKTYMEPRNTPRCCSPASEAYWSM